MLMCLDDRGTIACMGAERQTSAADGLVALLALERTCKLLSHNESRHVLHAARTDVGLHEEMPLRRWGVGGVSHVRCKMSMETRSDACGVLVRPESAPMLSMRAMHRMRIMVAEWTHHNMF